MSKIFSIRYLLKKRTDNSVKHILTDSIVDGRAVKGEQLFTRDIWDQIKKTRRVNGEEIERASLLYGGRCVQENVILESKTIETIDETGEIFIFENPEPIVIPVKQIEPEVIIVPPSDEVPIVEEPTEKEIESEDNVIDEVKE